MVVFGCDVELDCEDDDYLGYGVLDVELQFDQQQVVFDEVEDQYVDYCFEDCV